MTKTAHFIGVFILLGLIFTACSKPKPAGVANETLAELDKVLANGNHYEGMKMQKLDSLKRLLAKAPKDDLDRIYHLNDELGAHYLAFCSDSSALYFQTAYDKAVQMNDSSKMIDSRISKAWAQSCAGLFALAAGNLNEIDTTKIADYQKLAFASAKRQLHSYMVEYAKGYTPAEDKAHREEVEFEKYLVDHLPSDNVYRQLMVAQHLTRADHYDQAAEVVQNILKDMPENDNLYGMAAYRMSQICHARGDHKGYCHYLAKASISDIKSGIKETMALPELAKWLYNQGDVDRAYNYINASLTDAQESNARMRTVGISSLLPLVDEAYRKKVSSSRDELMIYIVVMGILFILACGLLVINFRTLKKASVANRKLMNQSKMQESYIGHFLELCSTYSSRLESMRRTVTRKLTAGQSDDLLKLVRSAKYAQSEDDDFFKVFDETFLDLYPDFLERLNALLKEDCRLTHKKGEPLTTELRIYAFVRLGVEESVRIAKILNCSVSTIYTYRNRMRGRALDRTTFEAEVLKLCQ